MLEKKETVISPLMYNSGQLALKYVKYLVVASNGKGHGIHSPFVFDFIVQVLNKFKNSSPDLEMQIPSFGNHFSRKYQKMVKRITTYYSSYHVRCFHLYDAEQEVDFSKSGKTIEQGDEKDIFVCTGLRTSRHTEKLWEEIKKNEKVTCSIDLFFVGVLFFKKDFKEKLDFVIRF